MANTGTAHLRVVVGVAIAILILLVCVCDIIESVPFPHQSDHQQPPHPLGKKVASRAPGCPAGKDDDRWSAADARPPISLPSSVIRHLQTRRWRTRVNRRLCSTDSELAESIVASSRAECVDMCIDRGPGCRAANYIGGDVSICELYHCLPTSFERDVNDDCQYIQVVDMHERQSENTGKSRTVIFIGGLSLPVQQVFLRGGVSSARRTGCSSDAETDRCAVDIDVLALGDGDYYDGYNAWRHGNTKLSWHGAQTDQGRYGDKPALGTPMVLTSSGQFMAGHRADNVCGDRYWRVDLAMDCSQTDDGWFEVRGYGADGLREWDITQADIPCNGTAGGRAPYAGNTSHLARCGYVNVFEWNSEKCSINHV